MTNFDFFVHTYAFKLTESYLELLLKLPNEKSTRSIREELSQIHKRNFNLLFQCKTPEQLAETYITGFCELADYYKKIIKNEEPIEFNSLEDIYTDEVIKKQLSNDIVNEIKDTDYDNIDIENDYKEWVNHSINNAIELNAMMK